MHFPHILDFFPISEHLSKNIHPSDFDDLFSQLQKMFTFPLYFGKTSFPLFSYISPIFVQFTCFCLIYVFVASPYFDHDHAFMLYWTPLLIANVDDTKIWTFWAFATVVSVLKKPHSSPHVTGIYVFRSASCAFVHVQTSIACGLACYCYCLAFLDPDWWPHAHVLVHQSPQILIIPSSMVQKEIYSTAMHTGGCFILPLIHSICVYRRFLR